jgi:Peptidase family M1 domain
VYHPLPRSQGKRETLATLLPFWTLVRHYQSAEGGSACSPRGTTGKWWAASGSSNGPEKWRVDLSPFAGSEARVSITYASDESIQHHGAFVDDIVVSSGPGTTSFEDDGDTRDGWEVPGAPKGSPRNPNDWIVGTAADTPEPLGDTARDSFARQSEIIDFLSGAFGPYPFSAAGGIVDDLEGLGFALENQTRPIYSKDFFYDPIGGDDVVVHELAHQWYGDSLAVAAWRHIWLNEGFATYAQWLWSEREDLGTAQEIFEAWYGIPANDPFWHLRIGDPGPERLFDGAVYIRGAMTLHRLRVLLGDRDFFRILRQWARSQAGGNVKTSEFVALSERISGRSLDAFFERWLFTPRKPRVPGSSRVSSQRDVREAAASIARLSSAGRKEGFRR